MTSQHYDDTGALSFINTETGGFTLIELAIVLVIIGLLTGGVLLGSDMIRSAELQTVTTDISKYQSAAGKFQDQYYALPGDFSDAENIWGQAAAGTCASTPSVGQETCDGNGNSRIEDVPNPAADSNEVFRFWQHLSAAGMLTEGYDGVAGAGGSLHAIPADNVPSSSVGNGGLTALWIGTLGGGDATRFQGDYYNTLIFGGQTAAAQTNAPILSPQEAFNIDEKIDDGRPGLGKVVSNFNGNCTDAADGTTASAEAAAYEADREDVLCALYLRNAF